ncbi:MAG TPA: hypothetical protein VFV13_09605 [Acidimicrobiia bacterium]|nr:hypothetical protein [Acidimicrobiia bacterium]
MGDLHAVPHRGLFTGNRGCLVDDHGQIARHHRGDLWITCVTEYRGWQHPVDAPGTWTPLFFLDDAVALAAGHRPCGLCRRSDYARYREAVSRARAEPPPGAARLNRLLATERLRPGRGLERAADRITWTASPGLLPPGTIIVDSGRNPSLVIDDRLMSFDFSGWADPRPMPHGETVEVLTPPTSVAAMQYGFEPVLHPSATM